MIAAFGIIIVFVIVLVIVALYSISRIKIIHVQLDHSHGMTRNLTQLRSDQNRIRGLVLELFIVTDKEKIKRVLASIAERQLIMSERLDSLKTDLAGDEQTGQLFASIEQKMTEYFANRKNQEELLKQGKLQELYDYTDSVQSPLYTDIRSNIFEMEKVMDSRILVLEQETTAVIRIAYSVILVTGLVILLISAIITYLLMRVFSRLAGDLREGITVLGASSAEIQTTIAEISTGAAETATAIAETTSTVEEIRQTSILAGQKANHLLSNSQRASEYAKKGIESSHKMIEAMTDIESQMKVINLTIQKLSDQNRSIGEITSTVADIADQSNLLAVNAAIEAAKAGEHGRTFTVVAQEIRSLAEQSKKSTVQVKEILNEIQKSVQQAVEVIRKGSLTVDEGSRLVTDDQQIVEMLTDSVETATQASIQISSSSQQQIAGMDQIVPAMENIRQASEQNVSGIRQVQQASHDLAELGRNLKAIIERNKL